MPRHSRLLFPRELWLALLILAAVLVSFLPTLANGFVGWDDPDMFLENVEYRGLAWENLRWMFTTTHNAHYHPVTWLTLGLDHELWGLDARGYHGTSLLFHGASAVLFHRLLRRLLTLGWRAGPTAPIPTSTLDLAAAAGALFWALHPLRVESVAWATERRDVVSGLFYLLTLIAYLRTHAEPVRRSRWRALAFACFVLSFLSKAWGITLPLVLLVLDVYPLRRAAFDGRAGRVWPLVREKAAFVAVAALGAALAYRGQTEWGIVRSDLGPLARLAIAGFATCFYVWKTLVPLALSPLYLLPLRFDPLAPRYLACVAGVVLVSAALWWGRRRAPAALAAWISFGLIVSPVIGIAHHGEQIAADRYTYLSSLPFSALLSAALLGLLARFPGRRRALALGVVAAAGLGALSLLTWRQTRVWHDDFRLWEQCLRVEPENPVAYNGRGRVRLDTGDARGALADFDAALRLDPGMAAAWSNRGMAWHLLGEPARARSDYDESLRLDPHHETLNNRGALAEASGDLEGALADYDAALRRNPRYAVGYFNRARVRRLRGDLDGALADYDRSLRYGPLDAETHYRRGCLRLERGDFPGAREDCARALELAPPDWGERAAVQRVLVELGGG
jgi:tetratricopeptide (TPR) repeat protein